MGNSQIQKQLFPELNHGQIETLLKRIEESAEPPAKVFKAQLGRFIQANDLTESFLIQGGYTKLENEEILLNEQQDIILSMALLPNDWYSELIEIAVFHLMPFDKYSLVWYNHKVYH